MPSFYVDDVDIDVDEFLSACSDGEREELIQALVEDGYIDKGSVPGNRKQMSATEEIFEDHLDALHGKWGMLTNEEEELIMKIANRFK